MFTAEVHFVASHDAEIEAIESLIAAWCKNGQVLEWQSAVTQRGYVILAQLPKDTALNATNNNVYASEALREIAKLEIQAPKIMILGSDPQSAEPCSCLKRSSLVLYTHYLSKESPIRCGDCFGPVPLYELPHTHDYEHLNILQWAADYRALDTLQMHTITGERFAEAQLWRHDSSLSKQGFQIARKLAELTNSAVFYYLHKTRGISLDKESCRVCPSCSGAWKVERRWHRMFDFKCDSCQLLSAIACSLAR